jgi:phosphoglycerate dehydrogenase-like enzyme
VALAEALGAPVFEQFHTYVNFPQDHPLHGGFDAAPHLEAADAVLVVESDVPWFPGLKHPRPEARIVHVGVDPLFSRYPIRGFPTDLALAGTPRLALQALAEAGRAPGRRRRSGGAAGPLGSRAREHGGGGREAGAHGAAGQPHGHGVGVALRGRPRGRPDHRGQRLRSRRDPGLLQAAGSYFAAPSSGGLGWGLGAALGAKLAAPDKTVICCVGDGAYIFGAPTAAHFVSRAYNLPALFVIFNNRTWNAVKRAVQTHARDGWAVKTDSMPLTALEPAPDYEMVCRASGGHGERVEDPAQLPRLSRAGCASSRKRSARFSSTSSAGSRDEDPRHRTQRHSGRAPGPSRRGARDHHRPALDQPSRAAYTEADLVEAARDVDVILASHLETISRGVLEAAPRLRLVIVPFIGTDKIDLEAATRLGILVANSPTPENFIAVAEATIGLVLMLLKRVKHNEAKLRRGEWAQRQDRGDFLFGKTVGLVGLGRVGSHVARRLVNWEVRLLASDPYISMARAEALEVTLVDLDTLLAESDIVSLHASLTDETRGLIGEKQLRRMKPTALLVNTARGEMADEEALARALGEGVDRGGGRGRLRQGAAASRQPTAGRGSRAPHPHAAQCEP